MSANSVVKKSLLADRPTLGQCGPPMLAELVMSEFYSPSRWRSAMNQIKDSEEEAPPSKTTLCEEHEGQRRIHQQEPDSAGPGPGPSCVSMKSDRSMDELLNFKREQRSDDGGWRSSQVNNSNDPPCSTRDT
ncbi:hypothetical protein JOB18_021576 [Solea senegalensis]|uniref:Uncharacterized protein n=1 Tax=Solea senegalensis TaxID=28829 RepID=A0AAV6PMB7_SOLSE|nr:hypothetical protein JOB18_021576 [Solea senegalensis]